MLVLMRDQPLKHKFNCVYDLTYHMVLVTKWRRRLLTPEAMAVAREMTQARVDARGGEIIEFGGEPDHLHLLVSLPPAAGVADFANAVKTSVSRRLRRDFPHIRGAGPALWSPSYFVRSCGGADADTVRDYVRAQGGADGPS